jgi:hypothetical protein
VSSTTVALAPWTVTWLAAGVVLGAVLIAGVAGVVRQGLVLVRSVRRMRDDVAPETQQITAGAARASAKASSLRPPAPRRRRPTR